MNYVIGIDGGGTKTNLKVCNLKGEIIGDFTGESSNIASMGEKKVSEGLNNLIQTSLSKLNINTSECMGICIGAAGAGRENEKNILNGILKNMGFKNIIVTHDGEIALRAGTMSKEGVILISGTGSLCYGKNSKGETFRAGGYGHIIGDEGSGYYIGRCALNAITKSIDGRGDKTLLKDMIFTYLNIKDLNGLINYVYRSGISKKEIADLCKLVFRACELGDKVSKNILIDSKNELLVLVKSVIEKLGLNDKDISLAVTGSVLCKSNFIYERLMLELKSMYPKLNIHKMINEPSYGAALMALDNI